MANEAPVVNWSEADPDVARFVLEQAELHIQSQLQCALASDQRATTLSGILSSVSAAIFAGLAALWDKLANDAFSAGFATASLLLIAAAFGAWAARPIDFFVPGSRPEQFYGALRLSRAELAGYIAENLQHDIDENERFMSGNQSAIRLGLIAALLSPVVGVTVWVLA